MFENAEIALEELPAADTVRWEPLAPRFVRKLQTGALINTAVTALGLLVFQIVGARVGIGFPFGIAWIAVLVAAAGGLAWPPTSVPRKGYAVREKDMVYKSGVIWQGITAIPFNRVQHVETGSTPLDRRFGLASLKIYTAGSSGGDLKIDGLPAEVAEQLRVYVLRRAGAAIEHS